MDHQQWVPIWSDAPFDGVGGSNLQLDLGRWSALVVDVPFLDGLGIVDRVSSGLLQAYQILNVVRLVRIRMSIRSGRMIA
jgi:hypothetical protein